MKGDEVFDPDEMYTTQEVVKRLKVHGDTVRGWLRDGALEGVNFGGRTGYRIKGSAINAFIASKARASDEEGR